jgi:hypothetical protein
MRQPPSQLLGVQEWASNLLGTLDTWTPLMFNRAITWAGRWMEGRLAETEKVGQEIRHKYTLEGLLYDPVERKAIQRRTVDSASYFSQWGGSSYERR